MERTKQLTLTELAFLIVKSGIETNGITADEVRQLAQNYLITCNQLQRLGEHLVALEAKVVELEDFKRRNS